MSGAHVNDANNELGNNKRFEREKKKMFFHWWAVAWRGCAGHNFELLEYNDDDDNDRIWGLLTPGSNFTTWLLSCMAVCSFVPLVSLHGYCR